MTSRRLSICLINPRSRPSYWTADYTMPFYDLGRRLKYSMANGALISVAALVPEGTRSSSSTRTSSR